MFGRMLSSSRDVHSTSVGTKYYKNTVPSPKSLHTAQTHAYHPHHLNLYIGTPTLPHPHTLTHVHTTYFIEW